VTAGLVGGGLWALLPVAWAVAGPESAEPGTVSFIAVAASFWVFLVAAPALLVCGVAALRRALGDSAGRVGLAGLVVAAVGYGSMAVGNGIEVASLTAGHGEVDLGHAIFLIGFLISVLGGILTGIVVVRRRRDGLSRASALLLSLALPLGLGIGLLGSAVDPNNDAWFWAAIAVPTGIAWVLLGASLRSADRPARAEFATAS
jgi:hypothetical protein